jgi:hypothetical protein
MGDTERIVREVSSYPKASSFSFKHDNQLIVEFNAPIEPPSRVLKSYNSKAQEILEKLHDYVTGSKAGDPGDLLASLEEELDQLEAIIDSVERGSIKEALIVPSQAELRPPSVAMIKAATRILRLLARHLVEYSKANRKRAAEVVSLLKNLYSEAIRGIASNSGRRMSHALDISLKLGSIAADMSRSNRALEAMLGAYLDSLINMVELALTGSVCMSLREK